MIIFRFSAALFALAVAGCGIGGFKPRNDLEAMLQGNVGEAIANLERYISQNAKNPKKVESELLQAGFTKAEFVKYSSEEGVVRTNCQFYSYRRKGGLSGFGAGAIVWVCEKGSGANFGYIAP